MASLIKIKIAFVHPNTGNGLPWQGRVEERAARINEVIKVILPSVKSLTRLGVVGSEIGQGVVGTRRIPDNSCNIRISEQHLALGINQRDVHHNRHDAPETVHPPHAI